MENSTQRLIYIKIPDEYPLTVHIPSFDSTIPLPLLSTDEQDALTADCISEEAILAGMLKVFAYERDNQHIAYYRDVFKALRPHILEEMTSAAILKIKNGDFELAEQLLYALEGLFPENIQTKLNIALLMDERSHFYEQAGALDHADYYADKALHAYKETFLFDPPLPAVFFNAGFFFIRQKDFSQAKQVFETYVRIETAEDDIALHRKQKASELIEWIETQALDDELFTSAFNCMQAGEIEQALEKIRLFLEHHPKVWNAWFLLGWALRCGERWEDASAAFLHCLTLGKKTPKEFALAYCDICNELAICLMEQGKFNESRQWLQSALEREPDNIKIISNLGTIALKEGQLEQAKAFFRAVLELYPQDVLASDVLKKLEQKENE